METNHKTMQQKAADAHNMCRIKGDSMLDNSDREIAFSAVYDNQEQAEKALTFFTEKARRVETEPCKIRHEIKPQQNGVLLQMWIEFSCQAEVILFQMATR